MFQSHSDHPQGACISLIKVNDFTFLTNFKISDFNKEYMIELMMMMLGASNYGTAIN